MGRLSREECKKPGIVAWPTEASLPEETGGGILNVVFYTDVCLEFENALIMFSHPDE